MKKTKPTPLSQLLHHLAPHKLTAFFATICSILNKLCDIVPEILIGLSIDIVVNQQVSITARCLGVQDPFTQLYIIGTLTAVLWIFESIFEYCYLILWRRLAQDVQHTLRVKTYEHLQGLDMSYFENKTKGSLLAIISDDINQLEAFLSEGPNSIIQLMVNIVVMGGIFFYVSPLVAVLTLIPIPFVIAIAYIFQNRLAVLYEEVREQVATLSGHIAGRLSGITTIKSYTTENYEVVALAEESSRYKEKNHRASRVNAAYIPTVRMGVLCGFIASLVVGGQLALGGKLAISMYSALVFLTQRFLWPFTTLTSITDLYEQTMASMRRITKTLHQEATIIGGTNNLPSKLSGELHINNVSFNYQSGQPLFENLSLKINANSTVAFVGTTGSGKSTIIKLLLRFYQNNQGSILLDGTDISTVPLEQLRKSIAFVSQETYLTNGTIRENICYGSPNARDTEIEQAAKMAHAHEFITQLPHGYNTPVGENGKNLSGGQRQRIAIARAILKNASIFIFDEATSALDNETEAAIKQSIQSLGHKHTVIIIAHRLSTIQHADTIFVMEKGRVIEQGNHQELLALKNTYAKLWNLQAGITAPND